MILDTNPRGRLYFAYSAHASEDKAYAALADYYADGTICEAEAPYVMRRSGRFYVMFPAE